MEIATDSNPETKRTHSQTLKSVAGHDDYNWT